MGQCGEGCVRTSQPPGCELQNPSPSAYTLQQTASDQNQAGRRSHQDLFGRRVHSEGTSMTPLDTSVTNKHIFSAAEKSSYCPPGTDPRVRKPIVTCPKGVGPGSGTECSLCAHIV